MTDRLAALYRGVAVHATADAEHRAALELVTLVMLADDLHKFSPKYLGTKKPAAGRGLGEGLG